MRVGLKADPRDSAILWVGLQPDAFRRIEAKGVGLKADPHDSAPMWVGLQPDAFRGAPQLVTSFRCACTLIRMPIPMNSDRSAVPP